MGHPNLGDALCYIHAPESSVSVQRKSSDEKTKNEIQESFRAIRERDEALFAPRKSQSRRKKHRERESRGNKSPARAGNSAKAR
jgi:hypothetical protein